MNRDWPTSTVYEIGALLGRGGMGEVLLARDPRMGREVALKRMYATTPAPDAVERFLREAKIQARLDHPAIVPVHELGYDASGHPYFTMKRLTGTTLAALLETGAASLQRMLRALVDVCLAIELAHSRRIVHRDLKPSNIMLGDYGEVYVLDWGVARVLSEPEVRGVELTLALGGGGETATGALLGTPGYMAPEQIRGEDIGVAVDVYALGSILFEILAGEPLHARRTSGESTEVLPIASTLAAGDPSPASRAPARPIPPELDAACIAALAEDPALRPTARALADRIQRYLDGDRDVDRRRALAGELLASAREALASGDPARRAASVHAAGRALALDPTSIEAAELVTSLVVAPPPVLPPELQQAVADDEARTERENGRRACFAMLAFLVLFTATVTILQIRSWTALIAIYVAIGANVVVSWRNSKRHMPAVVILGVTFVLGLAFERVGGPFVLTPILISAMIPTLSGIPWVADRRWVLLAWTMALGLAPFALEWLGVVSRTWWQTEGGLLSSGAVVDSQGPAAMFATVSASLMFLLVIAVYSHQSSVDRRSAQQRLFIHSWHLRQLLPHGGV